MSWPVSVSLILLWILVLLITCVVLAMVRQIGLLHKRIEPFGARITPVGPVIGGPAPTFEEMSLAGGLTTLGSVRDRRTLLVFISATCSTCKGIAPAIRSIARSERSSTDTILIADGSSDAVALFVETFHLDRLPTIVSRELKSKYGIFTTPYALLVDQKGNVRTKGIINSIEQLESLVSADELAVEKSEPIIDGRTEELGRAYARGGAIGE